MEGGREGGDVGGWINRCRSGEVAGDISVKRIQCEGLVRSDGAFALLSSHAPALPCSSPLPTSPTPT